MSTTIRVSIQDKKRLERLARRIGASTMSAALRKAIELAEVDDENFTGKPEELSKTLRHSTSLGRTVSNDVDKELAEAIR